ncbi:MAG: DUF2911 domain-containing protein [bacterium]
MPRLKYGSLVLIVLVSLFLLHSQELFAQQRLDLPRVSPHAVVTQRIGLTDVTIDYHRPGVKGREIWGKLVPYGLVPGTPFGSGNPYPWRAGANENTTITFTDDVTIEGQKLAAGIYGLFLIPTESDWTIIFSNNHSAWGSFFYDEKQDALRVTVTPQKAPHEEWLRYGFDDLTDHSAVAYLRWEQLKVPFKIEVDTHTVVLNSMRNQLTSLPAFSWQGWYQAANYCLRNDINYEEALTWIDRSIGQEKNFNNLQVKSRLLAKIDKAQEADQTMKMAVEIADESQLNRYGHRLLGQDKIKEAIDIFKLNVKRNPDSWNAYDSLAEGYQKDGNTKLAIKNFKKALGKAPENQKARIQKILSELQGTH